MDLTEIKQRLSMSNINQIALDMNIDRGCLDRIARGKGRKPHKRSLEAIKEYFLKVDAGYKFK